MDNTYIEAYMTKLAKDDPWLSYDKLPDFAQGEITDYAEKKFTTDPTEYIQDIEYTPEQLAGRQWGKLQELGKIQDGKVRLGDIRALQSGNGLSSYMPKPKDPASAIGIDWKDHLKNVGRTAKDAIGTTALAGTRSYRSFMDETMVDRDDLTNYIRESVEGKSYYKDDKINAGEFYNTISADLKDVEKDNLNKELWKSYGKEAVPEEFNKKMLNIQNNATQFLKDNWKTIAGGAGIVLAMWLGSKMFGGSQQPQQPQAPQQQRPVRNAWASY